MLFAIFLLGFSQYDPTDLGIDVQTIDNYQGKYLDIKDTVSKQREEDKASVINDIDFEVELIHRDEINVAYILKLLAKLREAQGKAQKKQREEIIRILNNEVQLRSKKELIEQFIEKHLLHVEDPEDTEEAFYAYWAAERKKAYEELAASENLDITALQKVVEEYLYTGRPPLSGAIGQTMKERPKLLIYRKKVKRITERIIDLVEQFEDGFAGESETKIVPYDMTPPEMGMAADGGGE